MGHSGVAQCCMNPQIWQSVLCSQFQDVDLRAHPQKWGARLGRGVRLRAVLPGEGRPVLVGRVLRRDVLRRAGAGQPCPVGNWIDRHLCDPCLNALQRRRVRKATIDFSSVH